MKPTRRRRILAGFVTAFAALSFVAACGDEDEAQPSTTAVDPTATTPATAPATPATSAAPDTTTEHSGHPADDAPTIAVNAVDYAFEDLPASVPAGTALGLTNSSAAELHEIVAFRIADLRAQRAIGAHGASSWTGRSTS